MKYEHKSSRYFENTFLKIFSNKGCKTTLKSEMYHTFDVLCFDKMQPITLSTLKWRFQFSFIEWKEEPKWLNSKQI